MAWPFARRDVAGGINPTHERITHCASCNTDTRQALDTLYLDQMKRVPLTWTCTVCCTVIDDYTPDAAIIRNVSEARLGLR